MPGDYTYTDPNDPNMGSQDQATASSEIATQQLRDLNGKIASNPRVQEYLRASGGQVTDTHAYEQLVRSLGYSIPPDMHIHESGAVVPNSDRGALLAGVAAFAWPLAVAGIGAAAGGTAAGAGGGAGAAGAGAGGMSGLAGSGYVVPSAALGAGGGLAPAATGGGLLATLGRYADRFSDAGNVLSNAASGNAEGRRADSLADMNAATANNRARVDVGQFNIDAPNERAKQVARGDLMAASIPDSQVSGGGRNVSFSGGIRPSLFTQATTDAGNALKRQSLDALLNNSDHIDPQLVQPRRAGTGENVAGGLGLGLNILGALGGLKRGTNGAR